MNWSKYLHIVSGVSGVLGVVMLITAWLVGESGNLLGVSQSHLWVDAGFGIGIAIWLGIATLIHQNIEIHGK